MSISRISIVCVFGTGVYIADLCSKAWVSSSLFNLRCARHVHAHPLKGFGLGLERLVHLLVGLADEAEAGPGEGVRGRPPALGNGAVAPTHRRLKVLVLDLGRQIRRKAHLDSLLNERDTCESKLKQDVFVILDQILDC